MYYHPLYLQMVGRLGLRSGDVETAIQDTMTTAGNKVKSLGDRFKIQKDETKDKYDARRADAVLDYDKSVYESKREWYQDVLRMFNKLVSSGALGAPEGWNPCPEGLILNNEGTCVYPRERNRPRGRP